MSPHTRNRATGDAARDLSKMIEDLLSRVGALEHTVKKLEGTK